MRKRLSINEFIWFTILLGFSYYFYKLIFTGTIVNFMHPKMIKYVYLGFIALSALTIYQFFNIFTLEAGENIRYGYIMFMIPLFLGFVVNPKGLNAYAVQNRGISVFQKEQILPSGKGVNKPQGESYIENDTVLINDSNYVKVMNRIYGDVSSYKGKRITIKGLVYIDEEFSSNEFLAARMVISCCAADVEVVGFMCRYEGNGKFQKDQWVEVTGIIEEYSLPGRQGGNKVVPLIKVEKLINIKEPATKYIYQ
jgi:putative membrane protein